ncbi:MAG: hypothetical protein JNL74_07705 [Fibrobacteres bacterium]|nr:hypothetical protein [Fibrobacterota bacterium]
MNCPPMLMSLSFISRSGIYVKIPLPLFLIWIILLPIVVLKIILALIADFFLYVLHQDFRVTSLLKAFYGLLCSLHGLKIKVAKKRANGAVEISII